MRLKTALKERDQSPSMVAAAHPIWVATVRSVAAKNCCLPSQPVLFFYGTDEQNESQ